MGCEDLTQKWLEPSCTFDVVCHTSWLRFRLFCTHSGLCIETAFSMSSSFRRRDVAATSQQHKASNYSEQSHRSSAFFEDFDSDHSSSLFTESFRSSEHPLDELFYHCSQVVSSVASLHETVCGSWNIFLQPAFKSSGSFSRSASIERHWDLFVEAIDKCSQPEVQLQLESQQNVCKMPASGAFSFVRLCQYLVVSKFENTNQQMKAEEMVLKMGLSRRNRRVKQFIFNLWTVHTGKCRELMVIAIASCSFLLLQLKCFYRNGWQTTKKDSRK